MALSDRRARSSSALTRQRRRWLGYGTRSRHSIPQRTMRRCVLLYWAARSCHPMFRVGRAVRVLCNAKRCTLAVLQLLSATVTVVENWLQQRSARQHACSRPVQVMSKHTEQEAVRLTAEASHLRAALKASENLLAERDVRIADLHADLHSLDARKGDLQVAVADASGAAQRATNQTHAAESRLRALQQQLRDADEAGAALREQLGAMRVRCCVSSVQFAAAPASRRQRCKQQVACRHSAIRLRQRSRNSQRRAKVPLLARLLLLRAAAT